eukprot:jgi/Botrbrau1/5040/Bobra.37_1s0006.1
MSDESSRTCYGDEPMDMVVGTEVFFAAHLYDEKDIEDTFTGGGRSSNEETFQDDEALPTWRDHKALKESVERACFKMMPLLYSKLPPLCQQAPLEALSLQFECDSKKTHTLILDMDQTLLYSRVFVDGDDKVENNAGTPMPLSDPNHVVPLDLEELKRYGELDASISDVRLQIWYRPGLEQFMHRAAELFEIVIFSGGSPAYVNAVVQRIPNNTCIKSVFTANHTSVFSQGGNVDKKCVVKDINGIFAGKHPRLPANVIIVDDMVEYFIKHLDNVVPIVPFIGDPNDDELDWLLSVLQELKEAADVREDLKKKFNLRGHVEKTLKYAFKYTYVEND